MMKTLQTYKLNGLIKILMSSIFIFGIGWSQPLSAQCGTTKLITQIDSFILCPGDENGIVSVKIVPPPTFVISEVDRNSPDFIEITNVSGKALSAAGHYVAASDDYTNIDDVNGNIWNLSGTWAVSAVQYKDDVSSSSQYWGSNLFFNSPSPGWVLLFDANDDVIDAIFWGWTAKDIKKFAPTINGNVVSLGSNWTGNGCGACTSSHQRTATWDNDTLSDWSCVTKNGGIHNTKIVAPPVLGALTYLWDNGDINSFSDSLGSGKHWVTISAVNGCVIADTIVLKPDTFSATYFIQNVVCFCAETGVVNMIMSGGTPGYSYSWSNGGKSRLIPKIPAGIYTVEVTDKNGCIFNDAVTVTEGAEMTLSINTVIPETATGNDGSIDMSVGDGNPPYTYLWSNGETTEDISGLVTGMYSVEVTDSTFCEKTFEFTVGTTVGIGEVATLSLKIFPNPSEGIITLQMNGQTDEMIDIQIINSVGSLVHQTQVRDNEDHQLNLQHLQSGMYMMLLSNSKASVRHQIILK